MAVRLEEENEQLLREKVIHLLFLVLILAFCVLFYKN